jgi:hypothetical protein
MKEKRGLNSETSTSPEQISAQDGIADSTLETRAVRLFTILQEMEDLADELTDEQFCGLVHQAVTSCGFTDAVDAWFSLLAITERKIGMLDFCEFMPKPPDIQN